MQLLLDTKGIVIRQRNRCFHLQTEKHERLIAPQKISSIVVCTHCVLTTAAIRLAIKESIPIYFVDGFGRVEGRLWSASFGRLSTLRRKQVFFTEHLAATQWAIHLFRIKLYQQKNLLVFLKDRKMAQAKSLTEAITLIEQQSDKLVYYQNEPLKEVAEILMGIEGIAARAYWQSIADCMPTDFTFENRNRNPAQDFFNAAINYLYGMLYTYIETALFSVGLDPYLGILHADQYDKPTLSYDLIEPFRPWVDRLVVENVLADKIKPDFFESKQGGIWLAQKGKQFLIPLLNTFLAESGELENNRAIRKNHIYRLAGDLVDKINEKIV
ncbi:CRISPR-associated endonuclease Cas1 [Emticicia soli]|uniref:CRISPR-associated endonuclease Cas1 n=1 Tax=Emticicia soli TaxID=2027878 RepID=A0ABW5J2Y4_9BACT